MASMRVFLALIVLCVSTPCIFAHNRRHSRCKSHAPTCKDIFLGKTDEEAAARYGVKMPGDKCVLTWEQFEKYIVGEDWIGISVIDDDSSINPEISYNFRALWTREANGGIRRRGTYWNHLDMECQRIDATFERRSDCLAKAGLVEGDAFNAADREDWFLSCDPKKFFIFFICYVRPNNKRCAVAEVILMVRDQRPYRTGTDQQERVGNINLSDLPWSNIEKLFKKCTDHQFVDCKDPQIEWVWTETECTHPLNDNVGPALGQG